MGDYERDGNDRNVYKNMIGSGYFLKRASDGNPERRYWMVCTPAHVVF